MILVVEAVELRVRLLVVSLGKRRVHTSHVSNITASVRMPHIKLPSFIPQSIRCFHISPLLIHKRFALQR